MRIFSLSVLLILCTLSVTGQTYKYIGVEEGLSNHRVYGIQKGPEGYMWFLTHNGIDRYNGQEFKHYKLMDEKEEVNSMMNLNWLYVDKQGALWEIGKRGRVYLYDRMYDRFQLVYKLPEQEIKKGQTPISYGYVDNDCRIWLCNEQYIYLYQSDTEKCILLKNIIGENITRIAQIDKENFFIGTDQGVHRIQLRGEKLTFIPCEQLDSIQLQINELYYHPKSDKLFIGTFLKGVFVYDIKNNELLSVDSQLTDVSINRFCPNGDEELLIATGGEGVHKMNIYTYRTEPYIVADFNHNNGMNGNDINDIYVDDEQRIWMVNYPIGITVCNNRYSDYQWVKHSIGNTQSLINDQVNAVIEDSEGDLWYATNNGISLYNNRTNEWHSFLSAFDTKNRNHTFTSLCEVNPGIIWAGGYSSGIYQIEKHSKRVSYFTPSHFHVENIRPDKYIRIIFKDKKNIIWSGGYYNLKRFDLTRKSVELIPNLNEITVIAEKDETTLWIGTAHGLYLLDKNNDTYQNIPLPTESYYIYSLFQTSNGLLYIGTNSSGLLVYDTEKETFKHYHKNNSSLLSNNIYSILYDGEETLFLSTDYAICRFNLTDHTFQNWTKEQGLRSDHFNPSSGTLTREGIVIFGSMDGAIAFNKEIKLPYDYSSKIVFSDFRLFYKTVYPNEEGSPLQAEINDTQNLQLKYSQNIFSLKVSSINYDYPSLVLYSWKLEGFYDGWSLPSQENIISFTNLSPGKYKLYVRAISNEDPRIILEERTMQISIDRPFWLSIWAILLYIVVLIGMIAIALRIFTLRRLKKISDEKIHFFVNTAHDIRTPLTLVKIPLEETLEHEKLSDAALHNLHTSLHNVNSLLRLTSNLINFERLDLYSSQLSVSKYELDTYMKEQIHSFQPIAAIKQIQLTYTNLSPRLSVWLDKEKMDSILKNILSNALKYTSEKGTVAVTVGEMDHHWYVEVKDDGIGIPASEQRRLFKIYFRGSNAINSQIGGSGIGLLLVGKLVRIHKGKIHLNSVEGKGTCVKIIFPEAEKHYRRAIHLFNNLAAEQVNDGIKTTPSFFHLQKDSTDQPSQLQQKILIVEDNNELREYLRNSLSGTYQVQTCNTGKEALTIIKTYLPDLIVSDIIMPEMRGDELCKTIKNDLETSHIPVILLTALNSDQDIIEGLQTGADEYIVKPFHIGILHASIANLLQNRAILREKFGNLEIDNLVDMGYNNLNCSSNLDWEFMANVRKQVEENMAYPNFNIDTLCDKLHMSRTSFYNKIKALTGQAPAEFIRLIRLKKAIQLLKEQKYTITEISEIVGFNDAKYFREVFKKCFGVSPTQYIKQDREHEPE